MLPVPHYAKVTLDEPNLRQARLVAATVLLERLLRHGPYGREAAMEVDERDIADDEAAKGGCGDANTPRWLLVNVERAVESGRADHESILDDIVAPLAEETSSLRRWHLDV